MCSVHDTGATAFIVLAPQNEDLERAHQLSDEVRQAMSSVCRGEDSKRVRLSIVAPPGYLDIWKAHGFLRPKIRALKLDYKDHDVSISLQKLGDNLTFLERATCQALCLTMGVTWGGCLSTSSSQ